MRSQNSRRAAGQPDRAEDDARHHRRMAMRRLGLALIAAIPLAGPAAAEDAMTVRPGFGYTIHFMSGTAAEALLPVPERQPIITRQGFGYAIHFTTGLTAEALLPVPKQNTIIARQGFGYTIDFMTGPTAEALRPAPKQEQAGAF
jgi:hypothetical protein